MKDFLNDLKAVRWMIVLAVICFVVAFATIIFGGFDNAEVASFWTLAALTFTKLGEQE